MGGSCQITSNVRKNESATDPSVKITPTAVTIGDLVKQKSVGKGATKVTAPKPLVTSSSECEPALCTLRPRPWKRHTKWELHSTSKYINYLKYGTDSNTESKVKPKNKKPRVGNGHPQPMNDLRL